MSTFDPENFGLMEINDQFDTRRVPVPAGDYNATVKDLILPPRKVDTNEGPRFVVGLLWEVDDQKAREVTGLPHPTVRQDMWLDISPQGALEAGPGKNVDLGKTREVFGLNVPGQPFRFDMFRGRAAKIKVAHKSKKDTGEVFANIVNVAAL